MISELNIFFFNRENVFLHVCKPTETELTIIFFETTISSMYIDCNYYLEAEFEVCGENVCRKINDFLCIGLGRCRKKNDKFIYNLMLICLINSTCEICILR